MVLVISCLHIKKVSCAIIIFYSIRKMHTAVLMLVYSVLQCIYSSSVLLFLVPIEIKDICNMDGISASCIV